MDNTPAWQRAIKDLTGADHVARVELKEITRWFPSVQMLRNHVCGIIEMLQNQWSGLATDLDARSNHGSVCEKLVALEDVDSGGSFLACSHKDVHKCNYVEWVDPEWPDALKMSLAHIWSMHAEETRQMLKPNVEENLKILREEEKIEDKLRQYKFDFAKVVAEKEYAIGQLCSTQLVMMDIKEELEKNKMADKSNTNIHHIFRAKAEKERNQAMKERDQAMQEMDNLV
ncbi:putative CBL-interacting protein kinase 13 [Hordeum vulgare]|nr:putative CBL-interacting protein kinase 13 [Hordeum vulgare]